MHLLPECLRALKYPAFWKREDCPSLIKFLESRLRDGDINDAKTEHHSYQTELNIIAKYYAESSEIAQKVQKWKDIFKKDKHSKEINLFWNLHQNIHTEIKLREEKAQLQQRKLNDLKDQISIEQTQHVLDTTKETLSQNLTLQKTVIKQHLLGEPNVENLELIIGQKRNCGSAFPKNKDTNLDYDDHERRNSPQKRQCTEPIADAENNPFFESENNLDKEKAKSKSQSISSPENENTPLIHNNVEDESQQCNDDESYSEVSSNSYDEDYYSNCELSEEVKRLDVNDALIRNIFLEVLHQFRSKDLESGKSIMDSNVLNGIIDITDSRVKESIRSKFNEGQQTWLNKVLEKETWDITPEFKDYCSQFTEDTCDRVHTPTLVRKSFVVGRFDPFLHEGHDIAQQLMTHFSVCLEAPTNSESKSPNLERTFAIDTTIYIVNRLFRMHQDVLDRNWMEMLTADTKNHKIDGTLIALKTRKKDHQTIGIVEFSRGKKAPDSKDVDDKVKLSRNAMRILNKLLETISCERARVYTIQCVNGRIHIRYMVRPLPSVYLYNEFVNLKLPNTFNDMEQFSLDIKILMDFQKDALKMVKSVNKPTINENVYKSEVETTPQKGKKAKRKGGVSA